MELFSGVCVCVSSKTFWVYVTEKPKGASVVSVFGPKGTISGSYARVGPSLACTLNGLFYSLISKAMRTGMYVIE